MRHFLWHGRRWRLEFVKQTEVAECGLACLAMILSYYGRKVSLADLRRQFGVTIRGSYLSTLMKTAYQLGLSCRPVRLEVESLERVVCPIILHWNLDHYVVLERVRDGLLTIYDPASGVRRISLKEASDCFTGVALELSVSGPLPSYTPSRALTLRDFAAGTRGLWLPLLLIAVLALLSQTALIGLPLFSRALMDDVLGGRAPELFIALMTAWLVAVGLQTGLDVIRGIYALHINNEYAFNTRLACFRHVLSLPASYFQRRSVTEVIQRFQCLDEVLTLITDGAISTTLDGFFCILGVCLVVFYGRELAALTIGTMCIQSLITLRAINARNVHLERLVESSTKESGFLFESIRSIQTLKLLAAEARRLAQYGNATLQSSADKRSNQSLEVLNQTATTLLQGLSQVACFGLGMRLVSSGALSLGSLFAFQGYQYVLLSRFAASLTGWSRLRTASVNISRISDFICEAPECDASVASMYRTVIPKGTLELRSLAFAYAPRDPDVLTDINLHVRAGECIAIVGATGCGKTTLLKVMASLLTPTKGAVLVDGRKLEPFAFQGYRSAIATILQDDGLFVGTVAENVCYPDEVGDAAKVLSALHAAQIDREMLSLPLALNTRIGELGSTLSAGQRQRLLLARAIYRRSVYLFLDEPTADLDLGTERRIVDVIGALKATRVVATHRPDILRVADRILTLRDGRLWDDQTTSSAGHPNAQIAE